MSNNHSIVYGGKHDKQDRYIAPTLITDPDIQAPIMQEEIFGPLLPILSYKTFEDVLAVIHAQQTPLIIYLFDTDSKRINRLIVQTQSGTVAVNDMFVHFANQNLPFGGIGASGFGSYRGKKSFETFSHYKSFFYGSCRFDFGFRYPPYGKYSSRE